MGFEKSKIPRCDVIITPGKIGINTRRNLRDEAIWEKLINQKEFKIWSEAQLSAIWKSMVEKGVREISLL